MFAMTMTPGATTLMLSVDRAIALGANNRGAGGDDDEQERSPSFREQAPPFVGGLQEIGRRHSSRADRSSNLPFQTLMQS